MRIERITETMRMNEVWRDIDNHIERAEKELKKIRWDLREGVNEEKEMVREALREGLIAEATCEPQEKLERNESLERLEWRMQLLETVTSKLAARESEQEADIARYRLKRDATIAVYLKLAEEWK